MQCPNSLISTLHLPKMQSWQVHNNIKIQIWNRAYSGDDSGVNVTSSCVGICNFLLWNLGDPRKLFLIVCSRVRHGTDCIDGEPGGVGMGLSIGVCEACFGLPSSDAAEGVFGLCKLFFLLKQMHVCTQPFISKCLTGCIHEKEINESVHSKFMLNFIDCFWRWKYI